jgi:hypothetical protein
MLGFCATSECAIGAELVRLLIARLLRLANVPYTVGSTMFMRDY